MVTREEEEQALEEHDSVFGKHRNYAPPQYESYTNKAIYLAMSEGHRIAIDVTLPAPLPSDSRIPTVLYVTRYWRAKKSDPVDDLDLFFTSHGYAFVRADERGTGASSGTWPHMWPRDALSDYRQIIDWIVAQPWSNGKVGGIGVSYCGTTAQMLAATGHPAVKAVIPKFIELDVYTDIIFPGGILLGPLWKEYVERCRQLDLNRDMDASSGESLGTVKPVDADADGSMLAAAIDEHRATNPDFLASTLVTFRDDVIPGIGVTIDDFSVHELRDEIERSRVAIYGWGSWNDACTAGTVLRRFTTFTNPQRAVIGAWNHGGDKNANQYRPDYSPPVPSYLAQWLEDLRFFDYHLDGVDTGIADEDLLIYLTMGEERWKRTSVWPPPTSYQRWYAHPEGVLQSGPSPSKTGADRYEVDFEASSGSETIWHTEFSTEDVVYGDRAGADSRLLTYTSRPLEADVEVTGHPVVTLYVTSNREDGAFFVYLEDVFPDGEVKYVTEGQLRALHGKVSKDEPPYRMFAPHHSYKRADAAPFVPGEVKELVIGLQPTSVLFRKGHCIRIAIAGHDKGAFERVPHDAESGVVIQVQCNETHSSHVDLPIIAR